MCTLLYIGLGDAGDGHQQVAEDQLPVLRERSAWGCVHTEFKPSAVESIRLVHTTLLLSVEAIQSAHARTSFSRFALPIPSRLPSPGRRDRWGSFSSPPCPWHKFSRPGGSATSPPWVTGPPAPFSALTRTQKPDGFAIFPNRRLRHFTSLDDGTGGSFLPPSPLPQIRDPCTPHHPIRPYPTTLT